MKHGDANAIDAEKVAVQIRTRRSSRTKRVSMKEIERLRLSFKSAEAEFQRASTLASSPRTISNADMNLRSAKSALQRYLDFSKEDAVVSSREPPIESAEGVEDEEGVKEDGEDGDAAGGGNTEGGRGHESWIFRRFITWGDAEDEGVPRAAAGEGNEEEAKPLEEDTEATCFRGDDPFILVGFPQFDSSIFTRTDF